MIIEFKRMGDYYDKNYRFMSENPADPTITNRVLTIMTGEDF